MQRIILIVLLLLGSDPYTDTRKARDRTTSRRRHRGIAKRLAVVARSNRNGSADPDQDPPLTWNELTNVAWKSEVPGRGHSSPTVAGDHVYLATCDESQGSQWVLCYDRDSGAPLWKTEVQRPEPCERMTRRHRHPARLLVMAAHLPSIFPTTCALHNSSCR